MLQQIKEFKDGTTVNLSHAQVRFESYGHNKITVELEFDGNYKEFSKVTRNLDAVDEAKRIYDIEQKEAKLFQIIEDDIEDDIIDWLSDLEKAE